MLYDLVKCPAVSDRLPDSEPGYEFHQLGIIAPAFLQLLGTQLRELLAKAIRLQSHISLRRRQAGQPHVCCQRRQHPVQIGAVLYPRSNPMHGEARSQIVHSRLYRSATPALNPGGPEFAIVTENPSMELARTRAPEDPQSPGPTPDEQRSRSPRRIASGVPASRMVMLEISTLLRAPPSIV